MKKMLTAFVLLLAFALPAHADEAFDWDSYIEQSNVLIGAGGRDFCSGTVISKAKRLILTAYHCVDARVTREEVETVDPITGEIRKRTIEKRLDLEVAMKVTKNFEVVSQRRFLAKIKGRDKDGDVALIQVTDESWVPPMEAKFAPDDFVLKRGMPVFVIGNPAVQFDNSLTQGIVSAPERTVDVEGVKLRLFQIDALAIGGNSGGQVVNNKGEIIGTLTGGIGDTLNFVVPISVTKTMLRNSGFRDVIEPVVPAKPSSGRLDDK